MPNDVPQSEQELNEHLADHVRFLELSADSYDSGFTGEAKRMATSLRVLLHDTKKSQSLLNQLGRKSILFYDGSHPINPRNKVSHSGIVGVMLGPSGAKPIPFLDNPPAGFRKVDFSKWWNTPIFIDANKQVLTRKDVVLTVADQDGGAHVDPKLEERYAQLSRQNSMGWFYTDGIATQPIQELERAAIRQITHELLKSLNPNYRKSFTVYQEEAPIADVQAAQNTVPASNYEATRRNQLCPCGSGRKFKFCHGMNVQTNSTSTRKRVRGKHTK